MTLLIVCGLPGSGKSFFARTLSTALQADYLSSDLIRKELFASRSYSEDEKQTVYETLLLRAKDSLIHQRNAIVDATFYKNNLRLPFYQLAEEQNVPLIVFCIQAAEDLIQERTSDIREDSEADFAVYLKLKDQFEPFDRNVYTIISERNNIQDMIASARLQLPL